MNVYFIIMNDPHWSLIVEGERKMTTFAGNDRQASPGETVTWLWWSQPGPGWWGADWGRDHWCPEQTRSAACGVRSAEWCTGQSCASPQILTTHTDREQTLVLSAPARVYPFWESIINLPEGRFSRRGRVTFSVTFIVTTWGSIGSLHSDKWHDPVDLNIVIMTLPLTIVILSSTVYLGHLLDPDTER